MEHFNEIVGTIIAFMFDVFAILLVYLLLSHNTLPIALAVLINVVFCFGSAWITKSTIDYWVEKANAKLESKKKKE